MKTSFNNLKTNIIFICLIFILSILSIFEKNMAIGTFIVLFFYVFYVLRKCVIVSTTKKIAIILVSTVFMRALVICFIKVLPVSDFSLYFDLGKRLLNEGIVNCEYITYFPHVIGYPFVLAELFSFFGASVVVAQILNIVCAAMTAIVVFYLGKLIFDNEEKGYWAAVIWLMWPSQIFCVLLVSTEPIFTLLLVTFSLMVVWVIKKSGFKTVSMVVYFSFMGFLCALINAIRPIGLIIVGAVIVYLIVNFMMSHKKSIINYMSIIAVILVFLTCNSITQEKISQKISGLIKQDVASFPIGFNVFIGTNAETLGMNSGNIEKAKTIFARKAKENLSAQQVHDIFLKAAFDNVKEQGLSNISLLVMKNAIMWLTDDGVFGFISGSVDKVNTIKVNYLAMQIIFTLFADLYYLFILYKFIFSIRKIVKNRAWDQLRNLSFIVTLILLSVCVHCIVEIQSRYHYPLLPMFALVAVSVIGKRDVITYVLPTFQLCFHKDVDSYLTHNRYKDVNRK